MRAAQRLLRNYEDRYAADGATRPLEVVESGMMNQAITYATRPRTIAPGKIARTIQRSRTAVASMPRYSARPPHTPAILRSLVDRVKRRWPAGVSGTAFDSGMIAQATRYAMNPPTRHPGTMESTTQTSRISVTSASR